MIDYSQPDFYRFNEDSLKLKKFVISKVTEAHSILDLGAGSGVVGIEVSNALRPQELTLVELQNDYLPHLKQNIQNMLTVEVKTKIFIVSFSQFISESRYDLIVCNPPYYLPGHGEKSADDKKQKARSFEIDNWEILLAKIDQSLTHGGRAFLVLKDIKEIRQKLAKVPALTMQLTEEGKLFYVELSRLNENGNQDRL